MAQHNSQSQRHELLHKTRIFQLVFEFAQLASVAQNQLAQAVQFVEGETWQVGVVQNVRAVLVVIAVRNAHAGLMQLASPMEFLQMPMPLARQNLGRRCQHVLEQALGGA